MKTKFSKIILASACAFSVSACNKQSPKLTISVENNISSIHRAEEIQISAVMEHLSGDVVYTVATDKDTEEVKYATVSATGLLKCSEEAPVGAIITVEGSVNGTISNPLTFTVQHTYAESIEIVATGNDGKAKENFATSLDEITLTTLFTPAYATVKSVRYSIVDGDEFAVVSEQGVVSLKPGIDFEDTAKNKIVEVRSTVVNPDSTAKEVSATKSLIINGILPDKIELSAKIGEETAVSIKRKDEVVLTRAFSCESGEEPTIKTTSYEFETGREICTISKDVLKLKSMDLSAYYGSKIKFRAVLNADESIASNWVELTVAELTAYLDIKCAKAMEVTETVAIQVDCQDGASNEFTIGIVSGKGDDIAEIITKETSSGKTYTLAIKHGQEENAVNRAITITATSVNDPEINDTVVINVIPAVELQVNTMNFIDEYSSNNHISFSVLEHGAEIPSEQIDASKVKYETLNAEIFTVDATGKVTAVNHGKGSVKVTYGEVVGYGDVNIMVAPTSVNINLGLTKTFQANHRYSYSKNETLKIGVSATNISGKKTTESFKYRFDRLVDGAIVETGNSVAEIDASQNITFKQTGEIKLTVTSISSLNGENTTAVEKSDYMIFDINEGVNVRTQEDLAKLNKGKNLTINFVNDIYMTGDGFGLTTNAVYRGLIFYGSTKMNGNGFKISSEKLKFHTEAEDGQNSNMFTFQPEGYVDDGENSRIEENRAWEVIVKDLEVVGMMGVNGDYTGTEASSKGLSVVNKDGTPKCVFEKGFHIGYGGYQNHAGLRVASSCLERLVLENCNIHNFRFGVRVEHAIYALVKDTYVGACYESGIIFSQCFATLENPWFGQVGTFAIEMAPDCMRDKASQNPTGCAGKDYNQTATLYLNGDIVRDGVSSIQNFNNGASTPGMKGFTLGEYTMPMVIAMLTQGIIQAIVGQTGGGQALADQLFGAVSRCLYKNGDASASEINLFLLIFVNPTQFNSYYKGNQEGKFGQFKTNNTEQNMITLMDLLAGIAAQSINPADYQYIRVDLDVSSVVGTDIGDAIVINQAYKGLAK